MEKTEENKFNSLIEQIKDYYKNKKIMIDSTSNIILEDKFNKGANVGPFYVTHGNVGLMSFDLSPKNIQSIIEDSNEILDVVYSSSMGYDRVRELINDYYFKKEGKRIVFIDTRKLKEALTSGKSFVVNTNEDEQIEISTDIVRSILIENCINNGFRSLRISFDEQVLFKLVEKDYKNKKEEKTMKDVKQLLDDIGVENVEEPDSNNRYIGWGEIKSNEPTNEENIPSAEVTPIDKNDQIGIPVDFFEDDGTPAPIDAPMPKFPISSDAIDDLVDFEKAKRFYEIDKRDRLVKEAKRKKKKYAFLAAVCMACTYLIIHDRMVKLDKSFNDTIESFETWDTTVDYFKDLGPLPTVFGVQLAYYTLQYVRNMDRLKTLNKEQEDYCEALKKSLKNNNKRD